MSKKTIIITWRFNRDPGNPYSEKVPISSDYEIIKFYTPDQRNTKISKDAFDELVKIISGISTDLFVFIHLPNFKNHKNDLLALQKSNSNININFFEGSGYIYDKFINQTAYELKKINADSIALLFEQIEKKYGTKAKLNSALMFLHNCLGNNTIIPPLPGEFINCQTEYNAFEKDRNNQNLRNLRDAMLKEAGVTGEN